MALQTQLKEMILKVLPEVDCVIGWGQGADALHGQPLFMRNKQDVEHFILNPLAVQNPAVFLPKLKGKKVALLAKGCDSRSIVQLIAEDLIKREEVIIIGFSCAGVMEHSKLEAKINLSYPEAELGQVSAAKFDKSTLTLELKGKELTIDLNEIKADKCLSCKFPNALIQDYFAGIETAANSNQKPYLDLEQFEALSLNERLAFWEDQMSRCIRCYACRNACPLCVCRDHCVASSREPHWISQADSTRDKMLFQVIHAMHLAGRCTTCGECQRACPVGIPVLLLKKSLSRAVEELFEFEAGTDIKSKPPLLTFSVEEPSIKEKDW